MPVRSRSRSSNFDTISRPVVAHVSQPVQLLRYPGRMKPPSRTENGGSSSYLAVDLKADILKRVERGNAFELLRGKCASSSLSLGRMAAQLESVRRSRAPAVP